MTAEQSIRNIERTMDAVNAAARSTPKPDPRADLVDLFEARAETHDDKSWITVEEAVDLVMDREAETATRDTVSALRSRLSVAEAIISRARHCVREEYARDQIFAVLSNPLPPLPVAVDCEGTCDYYGGVCVTCGGRS